MKPAPDEKMPPAVTAVGLAMLIPLAVVPVGIGISVLGFIWFGDDGFGSPPLFFKVFASFIALAFVGFGATVLLAAFAGKSATSGLLKLARRRPSDSAAGPKNYVCPQCSAPATDLSSMTPDGNVQCAFCRNWFSTEAS